MPNNIMEATQRFLIPIGAIGIEDEDLKGRVKQNAFSWEALLNQLRVGLENLRDSGIYTREGMKGEARKIAKSVLKYFEDNRGIYLGEGIQLAIDRREGEILSIANRLRLPDVVHADEIRSIERETRELIRKRYDNNDPEKRVVFFEAARRDDVATMRAFELAGLAFPLLDEDTLREGAEFHAMTREPEKYRQLHDMRMVKTILESNAQWALGQAKMLLKEYGIDDVELPEVTVDYSRGKYEPEDTSRRYIPSPVQKMTTV